MSFSLQVAGGDLVQQGSRLAVVAGTEKLHQDLTLWMCERYGIDRFHPVMGSCFQNYIGGVITSHTRAVVQSEANRILSNYQKVQYMGLRANPTLYSMGELLYSINKVSVTINYDTVNVLVAVSNAQQEPTTIAITQGT